MKTGTIEQAISLYSFEQRFVDVPEYSFDDMFTELSDFGVEKFELVGSMAFDQYPRPRSSEVDTVLRLADEHGVTPFSYGGYIDKGRVTGHRPTDADVIFDVTADLMTARDLGCRFLRETDIPDHLLPVAADLAERYRVGIGIEVHAPSRPSDAHIQGMLEVMDRLDSPYLGLIPDFGCFIERPAPPAYERHVHNGADPALLDFVIEHRHSGLSEEQMLAKVAEMGGGEPERLAIAEFFGFLSFGPADVEGFETLLHRALYFHSKFYHVTDDLQDTQIPLDRLLTSIARSDFEGVLMTEYEGHAFHLDDTHEQLARHLRLEQQILDGLAGPLQADHEKY